MGDAAGSCLTWSDDAGAGKGVAGFAFVAAVHSAASGDSPVKRLETLSGRVICVGTVSLALPPGEGRYAGAVLRLSGRFGRVEMQHRMWNFVGGLLGPAGCRSRWQLAECADPGGTGSIKEFEDERSALLGGGRCVTRPLDLYECGERELGSGSSTPRCRRSLAGHTAQWLPTPEVPRVPPPGPVRRPPRLPALRAAGHPVGDRLCRGDMTPGPGGAGRTLSARRRRARPAGTAVVGGWVRRCAASGRTGRGSR